MADEAREVSPFKLDKSRKSIAPKNDNEKPVDLDEAREIAPIMFTRPGEDYYISDDPDASPIYSDFRAMILPADSDVPVPGDLDLNYEPVEEEEEEEEPSDPKDLSAPASVVSSESPVSTAPVLPVMIVLPDPPPATVTPTEPESGPDADKDNGQDKENESSSQTSSSTPDLKSGKNEQPASD